MNSTAHFEYVLHKYRIKLIPWFALYETYNGADKFTLVPSTGPGEHEVTVFMQVNFVICKTSKDIIFVIFKPRIAKSLAKSFDICETSQITFRQFSEVGLNVYSVNHGISFIRYLCSTYSK